MKKLLILILPILFSGCASFHIGWAERHKELICGICTVSDSTSSTINTVPDNTPPDRNDSALINYIRNCNELSNRLLDSVYEKNAKIQELAGKIKTGQPDIKPLINPPKTIETITHEKIVENPLNIANEKQIEAQKVELNKKDVKILALQKTNAFLWKWALIASIIKKI